MGWVDAPVYVKWSAILCWVVAILCWGEIFFSRWRRKRTNNKHCEWVLQRVQGGWPGPYQTVTGVVIPHIRVFTMGDVYRKYMAGLPVTRKVDIINQLLKNRGDRAKKLDIPSAIAEMHEAELETLGAICCAGQSFRSGEELRSALPDAIILFQLSHPLLDQQMPGMR